MSFFNLEERNNMMKKGLEFIKDLYYNFSDEERKKYALVEANIKNFQYYNAKYGKKYGDSVLKNVYDIIHDTISERGYISHTCADTFHFFVEYKEDKELDESQNVLNCFLYEVMKKIFFNSDPILNQNIFLSVGIILPNSLHGSFEELIIKLGVTRKGCPQIKSRVNSFEIYNDENYNKYIRKLDLAKRLTEARVNNEFEIYIQPKVNINTDKIIGGEVLLRWSQNDDIPLYEYLSLLIEFEEIYLVDLNNFKRACQYIKDGLDKNQPRVPLSFNITNVALLQKNSHKEYVSIMEEIGLPNEYVEFEFLEDIKFQNDKRIPEILDYFKEKNIRCSLDDFGTGNSSFAFLLNGGIDSIKLDRMFFRGELTESRKLLLKYMFEIAKSSNVDIVSEGVEDEEYINYLKEIGGEMVQGFYYYKPMPLDDFQKLLDRQALN